MTLFVFLGFSLCENSTQHPVSPAPSLGSDSASSFSRVKYWPVSGTLYAMEGGRDAYLQGAFLFIGARNKWVVCVHVTFCFILCKGSNKYLDTCQKRSFQCLHRQCMSLLVWFSLYVVKGILIFIIKRNTVSENADLRGFGSVAVILNYGQPPSHAPHTYQEKLGNDIWRSFWLCHDWVDNFYIS